MNHTISKITAILSLKPKANLIMRDGIIEWHDTVQTQPSDSEIQAEVTKLQTAYDAQEYARLRKADYDQLNQLEMQFDDQRDGTTTWVDSINAIKAKHPKGGE